MWSCDYTGKTGREGAFCHPSTPLILNRVKLHRTTEKSLQHQQDSSEHLVNVSEFSFLKMYRDYYK